MACDPTVWTGRGTPGHRPPGIAAAADRPLSGARTDRSPRSRPRASARGRNAPSMAPRPGVAILLD